MLGKIVSRALQKTRCSDIGNMLSSRRQADVMANGDPGYSCVLIYVRDVSRPKKKA
jgi:hypothetical protein